MYAFTLLRGKGKKVILSLIFLLINFSLKAQVEEYPYYYRVYFRDKGANSPENFSPGELLSEKSLARRKKAGIVVPDYRDIPVFDEYIAQVSSLGYTLHCTSRWMNTALYKTAVQKDITPLLQLPFVNDVRIVKQPAGKGIYNKKLDFDIENAELPPYDLPLTMLNGHVLHNSGFNGYGVLIAVLDGGFSYADQISSLENLRTRKGIKATYDFVNRDKNVFGYHSHGTAVLSILAGQLIGIIDGTSPGADYMLLRTENTSGEFPYEEDLWAAGAEFADSAGADIISSSLGYFRFDDNSADYKFSDLDGNTAFVTKAADIAASKGIIVVNSAGNERNKEWKHIIAPSDGDSVIAVGAVDGYKKISDFSSAGPSFDNRIKPDNSTMGVSVAVQTSVSGTGRSSGTSFSCPVLSGMTACLLQAVPSATITQIIDVLHSSGDRYNKPDSLYGYGIPDLTEALIKLQNLYLFIPEVESVAKPNPTNGELEIVFRKPPGNLILEVFTSTGTSIFKNNYGDYAGRSLRIPVLLNREQGLYFIRLITANGTFTHKIIKNNQ